MGTLALYDMTGQARAACRVESQSLIVATAGSMPAAKPGPVSPYTLKDHARPQTWQRIRRTRRASFEVAFQSWVLYGFNVAFEAFGASIKLVFRIVEFSKIQELSVHTSLSCCPRRARRGESRARRALRGAVHTFVKGRCARFEVFF